MGDGSENWKSTTRWCLKHDHPAGPNAYAYCWDIEAENFPNQEFVEEQKEQSGCDIRHVSITLTSDTGQPPLAD